MADDPVANWPFLLSSARLDRHRRRDQIGREIPEMGHARRGVWPRSSDDHDLLRAKVFGFEFRHGVFNLLSDGGLTTPTDPQWLADGRVDESP